MTLKTLTGSLALMLLALTVNAHANNVITDLEQGLTPVQASRKALTEGVEAVVIAESLLTAGQTIDQMVATLTLIGLSDEEILAVLAALPPTAAEGGQDNQPPSDDWGQPVDGNGHSCNNPSRGWGTGCASRS